MSPTFSPSSLYATLIIFIFVPQGTTCTLVNRCDYTVWPAILSSAGSSDLGSTGFQLDTGSTRSFLAQSSWSGRFWARTGCSFDPTTGQGSCVTGDCGSNRIDCDGAGAAPLATLVKFMIGSGGAQDFYDVSLVDGYNLPVMVEASGGRDEYCCSGAYGLPASCRSSVYSEVFKNACPRSYNYAYDDATSTFTCTAADYTITFCPSLARY
ncbi:pathogenesis-related thaumatin superfamily protein [Striga asiatica]|uniref:Pathogenesis-related thaumatin superfamily protein n=1 Tax=Striga asiatica TaxID=4170 RepID=A0A5A7QI40_STRAF|nr:pathogenesis-related thaumatin superfamily protein [Striga asiatica]